MDYRHNSHSKSCLKAHLILTPKYRLKILPPMRNTILNSLKSVFIELRIKVIAIKLMEDHVHMLIEYPPSKSITSIVKRIKQQTTMDEWKTHRHYLAKYFWKEHTLWTDGYFASSVGDASTETVRQYIESQG